jgi:hypothetical protein
MTMKKILTILFLLLFAMSCEKEDLVLSEREKIEVKYLQSTRGMVIAADTVNVIQENPPFYDLFIRNKPNRYAFRHIVNYYDEGRENRELIYMGDKIALTFFKAQTFDGSEPGLKNIYWSNIPEIIEELGKTSTSTLNWSEEPLTIELGETDILEGLEVALPGCRDADSVQVYMTSNFAYGKHLIGVVPKNSMVAWYMKIKKVKATVPGFDEDEDQLH